MKEAHAGVAKSRNQKEKREGLDSKNEDGTSRKARVQKNDRMTSTALCVRVLQEF